MSFPFISEDEKEMIKSYKKFLEKEVAPLVEQAEEGETFPIELYRKLGDLGYLCLRCPEEEGGPGIGKVLECMFRIELSKVSQGISSSINGHNSAAQMLWMFGKTTLKEKYLNDMIEGRKIGAFCFTEPNAGSDLKSIQTTAVKQGDNYILNGSKTMITNGPIADLYLVAAYTDKEKGMEGMTIFLIESDRIGAIKGSKFKKEGYRSSETGELFLEDCVVPSENIIGEVNLGYKCITETLNEGRAGAAASSIGVAKAAYETAKDYVIERKQFGRPLSKFQAIRHDLAEMITSIEAAEMLLYKVARLIDENNLCNAEASMAKLFASEMAIKVTEKAIRLLGGYGHMREYPVGRYHRDALVLITGEGTSNIQKSIIAKSIGL